jgi:predicted MFS family arabinose efflux permease
MGRLGYQLPIFAACGLAALAALGTVFLLKESLARREGPPPPREPFLTGVRQAADNPVVSRVIVVTLIYMAGFSGMESTFGLWTGARFDWGAREVAFSFMAVGIVSVLCQSLLTGRLARRFGESRVLAGGCLLFGLGLIGQMLSPVGWAVPVAMAVGAFGMAMTMPNISAMISRASPPDRQGAMLGLNMAASSSGRIVGPIVAGAMFSSLGHNWPLAVGAALTIPAAIMAINAGRHVPRPGLAAAPAE